MLNITMPFCFRFVPVKLIVSCVPHNRLFSVHFLNFLFILLGVLLYDVHVK